MRVLTALVSLPRHPCMICTLQNTNSRACLVSTRSLANLASVGVQALVQSEVAGCSVASGRPSHLASQGKTEAIDLREHLERHSKGSGSIAGIEIHSW